MIPKRFFVYAFILILILLPGEIWHNFAGQLRFFLDKNSLCAPPVDISKSLLERFQTAEPDKRVLILTDIPQQKPKTPCIGPFALSYNNSLLSEIGLAIARENVELVEFTLKKYAVDYVITDESKKEHINAFLAQSRIVVLDKKSDDASLYSVDRGEKSPIDVTTYPNLGPHDFITFEDILFREVGDYISSPKQAYNVYYPFLSLAQAISPGSKPLSILEDDKYFFLHSSAPFATRDYSANRPVSREEITFDTGDVMITELNKTNLAEKDNDIISYFLKERIIHIDPTKPHIAPCGASENGKSEVIEEELQVISRNGQATCISYDLPSLKNGNGYLVKVKATHKRGKPLIFSAINSQDNTLMTKQLVSKTTVHYLVLPPGKPELIGYALQFKNEAAQLEISENNITSLEVYALPYEEILHSVYRHTSLQTPLKKHADFTTFNPVPHTYVTNVKQVENDMWFSFFQPYSDNWKLYQIKNRFYGLENYVPMLFGEELTDHVVLNNWANAWKINTKQSNSTLIIIYTPLFYVYINTFVIVLVLCSLCVFVWRVTHKRAFHR